MNEKSNPNEDDSVVDDKNENVYDYGVDKDGSKIISVCETSGLLIPRPFIDHEIEK